MTFDTHTTELGGLPVFEYRSPEGMAAQRTWTEKHPRGHRETTDPLSLLAALRTPEAYAWRLRDSEGWEPREGDFVLRYYERFCSEVPPETVSALVVGNYEETMDLGEPEPIRDALLACAPRWTGLRSLFYADLTFREYEASWFTHGDLSAVPAAFPRLERLTVRGTGELSLPVAEHRSLRSLSLQGGGLPAELARQVMASRYPALEHLDLWLGIGNYGGTTTPADLAPLLNGEVHTGVRSLGLRNAEHTDLWVEAVAGSPALDRLEELDLSEGTLTDGGAQVLLDTPGFRGLRRLDLHHHFMSEEMEDRVREAFGTAGVDVDVSERLKVSEDDLYPSVTE
ncbi:STM4015 family protein [Nocardiopsis sp. CC223A]|uniref:STM4015 family protein n=1 Tax=Nocardiopsis sp. CC223A TaxID=3044051 RepID=UPI00278C72EF|nr:STM4015 family protein [Nocardiopsis sp. CC223A]